MSKKERMSDLYGTGSYTNNIYGVIKNQNSSDYIRCRNDYDYNGCHDEDDDYGDFEWGD